MPDNLKELRNRINSVKSTEQLTEAMRLVSTARFGKLSRGLSMSRPYSKELLQFMIELVQNSTSCTHPFLIGNNSANSLVIVVSSERGLCGGYNNGVVKLTQDIISAEKEDGFTPYTLCIGKKGHSILSKSAIFKDKKPRLLECNAIIKEHVLVLDNDYFNLVESIIEKSTIELASILTNLVSDLYLTNDIGRVVVVYAESVGIGVNKPAYKYILPFSKLIPEGCAKVEKDLAKFEPTAEEILKGLIPIFIKNQLYITFMESLVSEYGARMIAMESATRNAKEMLRNLKTRFQRARQAAITNELIEIISGAEAL